MKGSDLETEIWGALKQEEEKGEEHENLVRRTDDS